MRPTAHTDSEKLSSHQDFMCRPPLTPETVYRPVSAANYQPSMTDGRASRNRRTCTELPDLLPARQIHGVDVAVVAPEENPIAGDYRR